MQPINNLNLVKNVELYAKQPLLFLRPRFIESHN